MKNDLFDVVLIVRLFLDILAVWGLIYMALRLFRNNYRTIQILKGILILLFVKGLSMVLGLQAFGQVINGVYWQLLSSFNRKFVGCWKN